MPDEHAPAPTPPREAQIKQTLLPVLIDGTATVESGIELVAAQVRRYPIAAVLIAFAVGIAAARPAGSQGSALHPKGDNHPLHP